MTLFSSLLPLPLAFRFFRPLPVFAFFCFLIFLIFFLVEFCSLNDVCITIKPMARFIEWHDFDQRGLLSLSLSLSTS